MKVSKALLASSVAAVLSAGFMAPAFAAVEVGASVGVASAYLWRGVELGSGTPAVSGDLNVSVAGAYAGAWVSSGDTLFGTEYDLYMGYGGSVGDFNYGISVWNYIYPTGATEIDFADVADVVPTIGYGPVTFTAYIPVGKDNSSGDYMYYTLGAALGKFSVLLGMHADAANSPTGPTGGCSADETSDTCSPVHLNVSYAYSDNLSFTVSQFVADETETDDMKFVVSYTLPLGE